MSAVMPLEYIQAQANRLYPPSTSSLERVNRCARLCNEKLCTRLSVFRSKEDVEEVVNFALEHTSTLPEIEINASRYFLVHTLAPQPDHVHTLIAQASRLFYPQQDPLEKGLIIQTLSEVPLNEWEKVVNTALSLHTPSAHAESIKPLLNTIVEMNKTSGSRMETVAAQAQRIFSATYCTTRKKCEILYQLNNLPAPALQPYVDATIAQL